MDNSYLKNRQNCHTLWDGIYQWPETPSNTTISIPCHDIFALTKGYIQQKFVYIDDDTGFHQAFPSHSAHRLCLENGQWGWSNWTNYTECLNLLALQEKDTSVINRIQGIVSYVALILLIVSLVSLILSIVIFISFKPLKCLRIQVHKNLCIALLMNCCLYIIMNSLVGIHKLDLSIIAEWFCKSLKSLNIYSSMATINWMFVEGFLFHKRLCSPFHANNRYYSIAYYVIGWLLPGLCVLAWSLSVEYFSIVSHKPCWEGYRSSNTILIVSAPMIIAVVINFIFLINIIRILLTKLRADNKSDIATIKAIKATALLIPLLGIHHILVLYNPSKFNQKWANIYILINVLFQSVQGIIVSVLYCFTNNEVRTVLNAAWSRRRVSHSFSGTQLNGSSSLSNVHNQSKKRRQSNGSNSFSSLINSTQINHNNNNHQDHKSNDFGAFDQQNNTKNNTQNSPNLSIYLAVPNNNNHQHLARSNESSPSFNKRTISQSPNIKSNSESNFLTLKHTDL